MFYAGAIATSKGVDWLRSRIDPGLVDTIHTTAIGNVHASHDVLHTNYHLFATAAIVEFVYISLL